MLNKRTFLKSLAGLGLAQLAMPGSAVPGASSAAAEPGRFPNLLLSTQDGKTVRFYDDCIKDKLVVLSMMYTSCSNICPPNTANLKAVQDELGARVGKDVFIYSLTLQPHIDRPEDLKAYAERYRTGPGWTFLTGKPAEMEILRKKLGFFDTDPVLDRDISRHSGVLRIGNERIDRWLMMPAMAKAKQIVYEINNLPA